MDDVASGKLTDAVTGGKTGTTEKRVLSTLGRFAEAMCTNGLAGWIDVTDIPERKGLNALTAECWVGFYGNPRGDIVCRNNQYMMRVGDTLTAYFRIDGGRITG